MYTANWMKHLYSMKTDIKNGVYEALKPKELEDLHDYYCAQMGLYEEEMSISVAEKCWKGFNTFQDYARVKSPKIDNWIKSRDKKQEELKKNCKVETVKLKSGWTCTIEH